MLLRDERTRLGRHVRSEIDPWVGTSRSISTYGTDNRVTLDAIAQIGEQLDRQTTRHSLDERPFVRFLPSQSCSWYLPPPTK